MDQKKNLTTPKEMGMKTIWVNNTKVDPFGDNDPIIPDAEISDLKELNPIINELIK